MLTPDVSDAVNKYEALMKQKDGTSRFVALFLLLEILEKSPEAATRCWSSIDSAFLDRLILAKQSKGTSNDEAKDLQLMGLSIMQAYMAHDKITHSPSYIKRCDAVMKAYNRGADSEESVTKIGQVLHCIAGTNDGAITIISSPVYPAFAETAIKNAWTDGISILTSVSIFGILAESSAADLFQERIEQTISLIAARLDHQASIFRHHLRHLRQVTSVIDPDRLKVYLPDETTALIRTALVAELSSPSRSKDLSDLFVLLTTFLRWRGHSFILQDENAPADQQLLLLISALSSTEIRSTLAKLSENQGASFDQQLPLIRLKVASCFDIIRIICLYLVTVDSVPLKPEDILKIRDNFSAVFSETIAYLRDCWDNSSFCPAFSIHNNGAGPASRHGLNLLQDPTIISGSQSLALWLQEDETAHAEASGIMDVLLSLVKEAEKSDDDGIDYASWLMPAISALLSNEDGLRQFSAFKGPALLLDRLDKLAKLVNSASRDLSIRLREAQVELDMLRVASPDAANKWEDAHEALVARIEQA